MFAMSTIVPRKPLCEDSEQKVFFLSGSVYLIVLSSSRKRTMDGCGQAGSAVGA